MTLKQFFLLCVFFFCCVYCDKNDSRSCFLHKTKLNYDLVDAEKLRVFKVTEKDISYGYEMAEGAGRLCVGAGVGAATLGMGCAAAQTSNVMRATVATVDTLEGLGAGVGLVKGGADMAENGVNSKNLAQVGSSLLTFIGLSGKACFTAGTQVVVGEVYDEELCTTIYVTSNIEDVKVGDYVLTQDVETGEVSLKEVTDTFVRTSDHIRYLTTVDEESNTQTIETTDAHPFWVVTDNPDLSRAASEVVIENGTVLYHENLAVTEYGYYVEAKDLKIGDVFIGANDELTTLTGTERIEYPNGITVYNFSVEGNHNYYVIANLEAYQNGASVVLVHNAGIDYNSNPVYRGGQSFVARNIDIKINKDGLVQPGHGVSANLSKDGLDKFGGAHRIKYIPDELEIIQHGKNFSHYVVSPKQPMTPEKYQSLLNRIITE